MYVYLYLHLYLPYISIEQKRFFDTTQSWEVTDIFLLIVQQKYQLIKLPTTASHHTSLPQRSAICILLPLSVAENGN